jgi:hypothetical protein
MVNCNDVMTALSQISAKSVNAPISKDILNLLTTNGCIEFLSKDEYEKLAASVESISAISQELEEEQKKEETDEETLDRDEKKIHSIRFWFEGHEKKDIDRARIQTDEQLFSKDEEEIKEKGNELQALIQKKSILDRQVPCGEQYLSLTGTGTIMLHELTIRNYRVGDKDFGEFLHETKATEVELQAIAERADNYYSAIKAATSDMDTSPLAAKEKKDAYAAENDDEDEDEDSHGDDDDDEDDDDYEEEYRIKSRGAESSQLWAVSIGLAKLEGDLGKIKENFIKMINALQKFNDSNLNSKLTAAETLVASGHDVDSLEALANIDQQIRQSANVPEEISAGIATTIFCGGNPDALTRFDDVFSKATKSFAAAALLSISKETQDDLRQKFETFKSIFDLWGYSPSEDADLAAAYMAVAKLSETDAREKTSVLANALKAEFGFPLVPAAILTSIRALNADELLDLAEKAASILQPFTVGLAHSELANLSIRMIYGQ